MTLLARGALIAASALIGLMSVVAYVEAPTAPAPTPRIVYATPEDVASGSPDATASVLPSVSPVISAPVPLPSLPPLLPSPSLCIVPPACGLPLPPSVCLPVKDPLPGC